MAISSLSPRCFHSRAGRSLLAGAKDQDALKRWQTGASRSWQRQQRRQWAERPAVDEQPPPAAPEADRQQVRQSRHQP
jgi:hypothetical protein